MRRILASGSVEVACEFCRLKFIVRRAHYVARMKKARDGHLFCSTECRVLYSDERKK